MAEVQTSGVSEREAWFRGHVMTRFFATVWWVLVLTITSCAAVNSVRLVLDPGWGTLIGAIVNLLIFIPIYREWPNWRRMGRMLRHGT